MSSREVVTFVLLIIAGAGGCTSYRKPIAIVGQRLPRQGDEIMVAGQLFHTGAPVVLWTDPGGYDAYRTERRFAPWDEADWDKTLEKYKNDKNRVNSPNRYGVRFTAGSDGPGDGPLTPQQFEQVRGGGWPLELLRQKVDQFVYHYDVASTSHSCFATLHDARGLSVQFMLDLDGTIYQTLDAKERAWQATKANSRSVGIEICNIGAYPPENSKTLDEFYRKDENGKMRVVLPAYAKAEWIRTPNFIARPAREQAVVGQIQGRTYRQYDLTPQQYDSLIKLTATLCTVLPKITCDYPRDEHGKLITHALPAEQYENYHGLLGHYHVQTNKQDPGPAFQWDKVINGARRLMGQKPLPPGDVINQPTQTMAQAK